MADATTTDTAPASTVLAGATAEAPAAEPGPYDHLYPSLKDLNAPDIDGTRPDERSETAEEEKDKAQTVYGDFMQQLQAEAADAALAGMAAHFAEDADFSDAKAEFAAVAQELQLTPSAMQEVAQTFTDAMAEDTSAWSGGEHAARRALIARQLGADTVAKAQRVAAHLIARDERWADTLDRVGHSRDAVAALAQYANSLPAKD
jgi:hypothetical protein